ncbi:MAG: UDP-N-acetylmuramate--L-alanine ligase [Aeromicrobium sp.]|nr:MAG: UDP-N-acetylmuramate--L-alanine ligase [Aeromicrobium sp.]
MRVLVPDSIPPVTELGSVHFVGIGGAGLSAIARLLKQQGVDVSGSDQQESDVLSALRSEGIECFPEHQAANVAGKDTVIVSTAVPETNPEVVAAVNAGARLWPRSAGLMAAMRDETRLSVAGTHGKTTTTSMLTLALHAAGIDASFAIGADVPALGTNARRGSVGVIAVESDESDGAFLHYAPDLAIITNIDADHLDTWGTPEAYEAAFAQFVDTVAGPVVVCADDDGCQRLVARTPGRCITTGFGANADVCGRDLRVTATGTEFSVDLPDRRRCDIRLSVSGQHYAVDALLAFVLAIEFGAEPELAARGLARYTGASRRMEFKGEVGQISVTDSYAHHPTEIAADLAAARAIAGSRRLVVVFQPHLVSRTRIFAEHMGRELAVADLVGVADIYLAREAADPEVTPQLVLDAVDGVESFAAGSIDGLAQRLVGRLLQGDYVLTLGAGDITKVGPELLDLLANKESSRG